MQRLIHPELGEIFVHASVFLLSCECMDVQCSLLFRQLYTSFRIALTGNCTGVGTGGVMVKHAGFLCLAHVQDWHKAISFMSCYQSFQTDC